MTNGVDNVTEASNGNPPLGIASTEGLAGCDTERADAGLQAAYAEGRKDERADWLPLLQAIQPLIEFNSSDEFITLRVRTADIAKARAAAAYVEGH